ncbi:MAG: methyltransferase family protein [Acidimicrobiales bacterium]
MQRILPPILVLVIFVLMVVVATVAPGPILLERPWPLVGVVPLVAGVSLTLAGSRRFSRVGTNIKTFDDPDVLVDSGLFGFSRNPMYLGFVMTLVGVALLTGALTPWIGPITFAVAAHQWYIAFEEQRMAAVFGPTYERYRARVPRWFGAPRRLEPSR